MKRLLKGIMIKFKDILKKKETPLISFIMIDEVRWDSCIGPQYIIGKDKNAYKIYIGDIPEKNDTDDFTNLVGLWVDGFNYDKIDHTKSYILINDIEINYDAVNSVYNEHLNDSKVINNATNSNRKHIHITRNDFLLNNLLTVKK